MPKMGMYYNDTTASPKQNVMSPNNGQSRNFSSPALASPISKWVGSGSTALRNAAMSLVPE